MITHMQNFMEDMKIMYNIYGKYKLKEMLVLIIYPILVVIFLGKALEVQAYLKYTLIISPIIGLCIGYLMQYYYNFRPLFKEIHREQHLQSKYAWHYKKFQEKS